MSIPGPDENQPMRDALQRDASQAPKPNFDPALHYATMRRIRELTQPSIPQWNLVPLFTSAAVLVLLAAILVWQMRTLPGNRAATQPQPEHPLPRPIPSSFPLPGSTAPMTSMLAYRTAAVQGDDALVTILDRDASFLLPASAPVFTAPLP